MVDEYGNSQTTGFGHKPMLAGCIALFSYVFEQRTDGASIAYRTVIWIFGFCEALEYAILDGWPLKREVGPSNRCD